MERLNISIITFLFHGKVTLGILFSMIGAGGSGIGSGIGSGSILGTGSIATGSIATDFNFISTLIFFPSSITITNIFTADTCIN